MERMNFFVHGQKVMKALNSFGAFVTRSGFDQKLLNLVYIRVSQLNGCAFCLDMHTKDLRVMGETEQRMLMLGAWHDARIYTERERAALGWAEALTQLSHGGVPDNIYDQAAAAFTEAELADLTAGILAINSYNRINVAFRTPAGDYQPGQFASVTH